MVGDLVIAGAAAYVLASCPTAASTKPPPVVLGIETSCDETAAALVDGERRVLAEALYSQEDRHAPFGGVVPEIAARAHVLILDRLIARVMAEAGLRFDELAGVAATAGPGLIGGLIVGLVTAKAICAVHRLPLLAINHLEGHALTARLTDDAAFPYLLLLISGGHCQLLVVEGVGRYRRLGTTLDDALGEAFDKAAKMLGLGFPGGPAVERAARAGDPRPLPAAAAAARPAGLPLLVLRPQDRAAPDHRAPRPGGARAARAERPLRELPGRGRRHPGRPHRRMRRRCSARG